MFTPQQETEALQRLAQMLGDYLAQNHDAETPVLRYVPARELDRLMDFALGPPQPDLEATFKHLQTFLDYSVRGRHPQFFNQLWAGFTLPGMLGELTAAVANTSLYTYEMAPLGTRMEQELTRHMAQLAGWPHGEGQLVPGGSSANLVAMLAARHRLLPEFKTRGLQAAGGRALRVYVSREAHFSFDKAANQLGIGEDNVVKLPSNPAGQLDVEAMDEAIAADHRAGHLPLMAVGIAGTTVKGAFDDLNAVAQVARRHNLWFHADGAWGGSVLISPRHRHLMAGVELADSLAWNPHKTLSVPLPCSVVLFRQPGTQLEACRSGNADYIYHDYENAAHDPGPASLLCGRKNDALKIWLSWKFLGDEGYAQRIDHLFELARHFEELVAAHPHFELRVPRSSYNVCFRWNPRGQHLSPAELDRLNLDLRTRLVQSGRAMTNYAHHDDGTVMLRQVFANPDLPLEVGERLLRNLEISVNPSS